MACLHNETYEEENEENINIGVDENEGDDGRPVIEYD
jgi:hypothetical protein